MSNRISSREVLERLSQQLSVDKSQLVTNEIEKASWILRNGTMIDRNLFPTTADEKQNILILLDSKAEGLDLWNEFREQTGALTIVNKSPYGDPYPYEPAFEPFVGANELQTLSEKQARLIDGTGLTIERLTEVGYLDFTRDQDVTKITDKAEFLRELHTESQSLAMSLLADYEKGKPLDPKRLSEFKAILDKDAEFANYQHKNRHSEFTLAGFAQRPDNSTEFLVANFPLDYDLSLKIKEKGFESITPVYISGNLNIPECPVNIKKMDSYVVSNRGQFDRLLQPDNYSLIAHKIAERKVQKSINIMIDQAPVNRNIEVPLSKSIKR